MSEQLQQLSQGVASALDEPLSPAAAPSLHNVMPTCMAHQQPAPEQWDSLFQATAQPAAASAVPLKQQSSSPGSLPPPITSHAPSLLPSLANQPQQAQAGLQGLCTQSAPQPEQPVTWLAWENQVYSEQPGMLCGQLADEYMHPHTQWVLDQPLARCKSLAGVVSELLF